MRLFVFVWYVFYHMTFSKNSQHYASTIYGLTFVPDVLSRTVKLKGIRELDRIDHVMGSIFCMFFISSPDHVPPPLFFAFLKVLVNFSAS